MNNFLRSSAYAILSKNSILFFVLFAISLTSSGQGNSYKNHPGLNAKDYRRSEEFASSRADENGSMKGYIEAMQKVKDSLRVAIESKQMHEGDGNYRNSYRRTQFYPLGPSVTTDPVLAQLGLVSALWVDTSNYTTLYAGMMADRTGTPNQTTTSLPAYLE